MREKIGKATVWRVIQSKYGGSGQSFSLPELQNKLIDQGFTIPDRTLRRNLVAWVEENRLNRTGKKRGTRYHLPLQESSQYPEFLDTVPQHRRAAVLNRLRNLWTHGSTALEGNTLTLGDTHAILNLGLTIAGKPLREHQEVVGHARAIDLLYQMMKCNISTGDLFDLHRAVQLEVVMDTLAPVGQWKVEHNYTSSVTSDNRAVTITYSAPGDIPTLMERFVQEINKLDNSSLSLQNAPSTYARRHLAFVHMHPFADGNGRMARLIANLPLLKAGLPPLLIDKNKRREYITLLADYQSRVRPPTVDSATSESLWPNDNLLAPFQAFCAGCYEDAISILETD